MPTPKGMLLKTKLAEIDRTLLPADTPKQGTAAFQNAVSQLLRRLFRRLGGQIEALVFTSDEVTVKWQPGPDGIDPIVNMLKQGEYREAILLLELLLSDQRDDPVLLYNLGMAYSDSGALERALVYLRRLMAVAPGHVNGRVALGVALSRQRKYAEAQPELSRAVADEPANPWAQRNLGAVLLNLERPAEALEHLRRAVDLNPDDARAWYGLAQALELTGDEQGADAAYRRVVAIDDQSEVAELAKQALSKLADRTFRATAPGLRPDAVFYCLGALERFENMAVDEVQKIGFEIATLGMSGLDVNDPTPKYRLRSLPGEFSGLHLVSIQYVAFKIFAPQIDIGFDVSQEYEAALSMHRAKSAQ